MMHRKTSPRSVATAFAISAIMMPALVALPAQATTASHYGVTISSKPTKI
jgi:hypothetical protein